MRVTAMTMSESIFAKLGNIRTCVELYTSICDDAKGAGCHVRGIDPTLVDTLESEYMTTVAGLLLEDSSESTEEFQRVITSIGLPMNCANILADVSVGCAKLTAWLHGAVKSGALLRAVGVEYETRIESCLRAVKRAEGIELRDFHERKQYRNCKCGDAMRVLPEIAEMHCDTCGKVKHIFGETTERVVESKSKHNGREIVRHFKFWMERLQAIENVTFQKEMLENIRYVIARDKISAAMLNCEEMRRILKDPYVSATKMNDHAPLLVKMFGGRPPPVHDYDDLEVTKTRFVRVMTLYIQVNPEGGNKPYYPHYIYKIIEEQHKNSPEKLRTLDYIHLQSDDTVAKNDEYYREICALANDPASGLVFRPTTTQR